VLAVTLILIFSLQRVSRVAALGL